AGHSRDPAGAALESLAAQGKVRSVRSIRGCLNANQLQNLCSNMERPNAILLQPRIRDLIVRQPAGHGMLREFYSDEEVYRADCEAVCRSGWLFAGHSCEIGNPGQ